jgi:hypothetical protein
LTAEQKNQKIATKYKNWQESPCQIDPVTKQELPCFAREINRLEKNRSGRLLLEAVSLHRMDVIPICVAMAWVYRVPIDRVLVVMLN